MSFTRTEEDGVVTLTMQGGALLRLLEQFEDLIGQSNQVVLDLGDTQITGPDDLVELIHALNLCYARDGVLVLTNVPSDLLDILVLLELETYFVICPEVAEAQQIARQLTDARSPLTTLAMIAQRTEQLIGGLQPLPIDVVQETARYEVTRVKSFIQYLAPTPEWVELHGFLLAQGRVPLEIAKAAEAVMMDHEWVEAAFERLEGLKVLVAHQGRLRFAPGPQTRELIEEIVRLWADPANRDKLVEWQA